MAKYLLIQNYEGGVGCNTPMGAWDPAKSWTYQRLPLHAGAERAFREAGAKPA